MASVEGEAAQAASKGADPERTLAGEDPATASLKEARWWFKVYAELTELEEQLFDDLASTLGRMPADARNEAMETNLPVIQSQLRRFSHRRGYWSGRVRALQSEGERGKQERRAAMRRLVTDRRKGEPK